MFNLLLTLLLMATTPELKLQEVQQPMMVEQRQETIGGIGYTQRPINARTQTRNRYLDGVRAITTKQIPLASGRPTDPIKIDGFAYSTTGNYNFSRGTNDRVYIPENGTYSILLTFKINDGFGDLGEHIISINKNGASFLYGWGAELNYFYGTFNLNAIENLKKGDYLQVYIETPNEYIRTLDFQLSLTKLS